MDRWLRCATAVAAVERKNKQAQKTIIGVFHKVEVILVPSFNLKR